MARRINWSRIAQSQRISIFDYWNQKNKSKRYSRKLNHLINETLKILTKYPHLGKATDLNQIRIKFISHYALVYEFNSEEIRVLLL